jgi:hypothetical protein
MGGPRLRWFHDTFIAQLFFGSDPVLDIFSLFAPTLKIEIMRSASNLLSRWFSAYDHGNLLGWLS